MKRILIVEDDKMLCTIFEMFIKQLGYELTGISHSGIEAIELCRITKPDVVLMDIHLSDDMDGITAARMISENFNIPVIYITSDIEESTIKKAIYKNTYGFLMKPIYQTSLRVAIEFADAKHLYDSNYMKSGN
ncbi:MAG: response regulator [Bacteroidales bacterium]